LNTNRRHFLEALLLASGAGLFARSAGARSRLPHGGALHLSLPLRTAALDPHDPYDLSAALLGSAVFETLYASPEGGQPYPTLARALPRSEGGRSIIELRPYMQFSSGRPVDANAVVASLNRSQRLSSTLKTLGAATIQRGNRLALSLPPSDPQKLARLLSSPRSAVLPPDYSPESPDACGAFRVTRSGSQVVLLRNERAPRGAAFLDRITLTTASISDCLREFEAKRADVGFLGAGLHHDRHDSTAFRLSPFALAFVQPGALLQSPLPVGALNDALERVPAGPFLALGAERPRASVQAWSSGAKTIMVSHEDPWLAELTRELTVAWSTLNHPLKVDAVTHRDYRERLKSGRYELALRALCFDRSGAQTVTDELFTLDGRLAPRAGRVLQPVEAARQLQLGVLGSLGVRGAIRQGCENLASKSHFTLENTTISK
jgi:peptide/nickel transport system substrate-binding protein